MPSPLTHSYTSSKILSPTHPSIHSPTHTHPPTHLHPQAALDDATTLIAEGSDISTGPSSGVDLWTRIKRDASAKLTQSHFSLLDLNQRATPAEVKKAYRQQCIAWHPDKHVASEDAKVRRKGNEGT